MLPRANWANLISTSPLVVVGMQSSSTAVTAAASIAQADSGAGANVMGVGVMTYDGSNARFVAPASLLADGASGVRSLSVALQIFNSATYDKLRTANSAAGATGTGLLGVGLLSSDGTNFQKLQTNSAANMAQTTQPFAQQVAAPGEWGLTQTPSAATQATVTKAAGAAGVRHVARTISWSVGGIGAQISLVVALLDGASIIWSKTVALPANGFAHGDVNVNLVGSAATSMTLQTIAAPAANVFASVALTGYDTV